MKILARELNRNGGSFVWFVFTATPQKDAEPNMVFMPPRLDITSLMPAFDAYIQLSDNEGFCLSAVEALMQGVPVIGTDLPVFREIGMNASNSILLDLDMKEIPVEKIRTIREKRFVFKAPKESWGKYLAKTKSTYKPAEYTVRATGEWQRNGGIKDVMLGHVPVEGETWTVDENRLKTIEAYENKNEIRLLEILKKPERKE